MNNEFLELLQEFVMNVKHELDDNSDIQKSAELLDEAIAKELAERRES